MFPKGINCSMLVMLLSRLLTALAHDTQLALVGDDVHLHCPCPASTGDPYLVWQNELNVVAQYVQRPNNLTVLGQGRTHLYYPQNEKNCSLLLRNVSVFDEHIYRCFYKNGDLVETQVSLQVAANYTLQVDVNGMNSGTGIYHCQAKGGYPRGRLFWLRNGEPIVANTTQDQDHFSKLYTLTSTLYNSMDNDTILQCVVENPRLHLNTTAKVLPAPPVVTPTMQQIQEPITAASVVPITVGILISILITVLLIKRYRRQHLTQFGYTGASQVV
ncbi:T-lymphocyte activation antigen CD80 isoform X2 [Brienomyrus brachyistius]|uniref:T-lymphocyte activation antigen CD80 isoform X2 n=1 Tax=Brienomyrus brachyistius TaxID=42636 RepID=UPI0020B308FD|nr:T-lymphocyte activation antigen CD80 isoform X2 [Brienomyrus brachyistius]